MKSELPSYSGLYLRSLLTGSLTQGCQQVISHSILGTQTAEKNSNCHQRRTAIGHLNAITIRIKMASRVHSTDDLSVKAAQIYFILAARMKKTRGKLIHKQLKIVHMHLGVVNRCADVRRLDFWPIGVLSVCVLKVYSLHAKMVADSAVLACPIPPSWRPLSHNSLPSLHLPIPYSPVIIVIIRRLDIIHGTE